MNPLEQLKDIHLPAEVSFWPPAYGWWILLIACLFSLFLLVKWWRKRSRYLVAKKEALKLLKQLSEVDPNWQNELNIIIKRACLSYFPPELSASEHGDGWSKLLNSLLPAKKRQKYGQNLQRLQDSLYQASPESLDFSACVEEAKYWVTHALPPKRKQETSHV